MSKCECGCGQEVNIAKQTRSAKDHIRGLPVRFIGDYRQDGAESGRVRIATLALLPVVGVLGILLLTMSFIEQVAIQTIGGIAGGVVVGAVLITLPWLSDRYRHFGLRYLNPNEDLTAENMRESTSLRLRDGEQCVRLSVRPREGIILQKMGFASFDHAPFWKRL